MKKVFTMCCLIMYLICFSTNAYAFSTEPVNNAKQGIPYKYTPAEGSIEELYKDIIVTLLQPYITDEITKQYGELLQYELSDIEFLKIERPSSSFDFLIKLKVKPFVGAHDIIGIDEMIINIIPGSTKIKKFNHIKSFPIPPYLKEEYKNLKL